MVFLVLWLCLVGIAGAEVVEDRTLPPQQGVLISEWTYRSAGLLVKGELYIPKGSGKRPAVIFCHDGSKGISKEHRLSSIRLARSGYVVFSPSYRGEDGSEGTVEIAKGEVEDVLEATELVARLPQVDEHRIALVGTSHGALICALAGARTGRPRALVLAYGVMDIYKWWDYLVRANKVGNDVITRRTYGKGPKDRPASFAIRHALEVAPRINCPVLILQGGKDDIVPAEQARYMEQALKAAGKEVQVEIYPDALHGFLVYVPYLKSGVDPKERAQTEVAWKAMLEFLRKNLAD